MVLLLFFWYSAQHRFYRGFSHKTCRFTINWFKKYLFILLNSKWSQGIRIKTFARYRGYASFWCSRGGLKCVKASLKCDAVLLKLFFLKAAISGILRAVGAQMAGSITNLIGLYLIGLPIAIVLMLKTSLSLYGDIFCIQSAILWLYLILITGKPFFV